LTAGNGDLLLNPGLLVRGNIRKGGFNRAVQNPMF
jgi:hypothetical protein